MMTQTHTPLRALLTTAMILTGILAPVAASAYLLPEQVLLSDEYVLPPSARETDSRATQQALDSAARREEEYQAEYERQHPELFVEEDTTHASAPEGDLGMGYDGNDLDLLRTIRLLGRVEAQQEFTRLTSEYGLHAGAPLSPYPLTPSGPGAILSAATMLGATGWTLRRAGKRTIVRKK